MSIHTNKRLLQLYPQLKAGIDQVKRTVLGHYPNTNTRTGYQGNKIQLKGVYLNQYYMDPIDKFARKVNPGFMFDQEERRKLKLIQLRRRGIGPPKKGAGARSKKKKK